MTHLRRITNAETKGNLAWSPIVSRDEACKIIKGMESCNNFSNLEVSDVISTLSADAEIVVGTEYSPVIYIKINRQQQLSLKDLPRWLDIEPDEIDVYCRDGLPAGPDVWHATASYRPPYLQSGSWLRLWWD